jgi:type II secretory pathway predicted ATPase ExeA
VGSDPNLFSDSACKLIAEASGGIPHTINILCDTALVYGFAGGARVITEEIVASAIDNKNRFGVLPISMPAT